MATLAAMTGRSILLLLLRHIILSQFCDGQEERVLHPDGDGSCDDAAGDAKGCFLPPGWKFRRYGVLDASSIYTDLLDCLI